MHAGEAQLDLPTLHDTIGRLSKHFVRHRRAVQVPAGLLAVGGVEAVGAVLDGCAVPLGLAAPAALAAAAAAAALCGALAGVGFKTVVTPPGNSMCNL